MSAVIQWCRVKINGGSPLPCEVRREQDVQIIEPGVFDTEPDLDWSVLDKHGHFHAYDGDGKLPTLSLEWESDGDEDAVSTYHCQVCRTQIVPKRRPGGKTISVPGRVDWTVVVTGWPPPATLKTDTLFSLLVTPVVSGRDGDAGWFGFMRLVEINTEPRAMRSTFVGQLHARGRNPR